MKKYFITGIDTNVGKTIISAILTEKLQADYWKPIQSGDLENTDSNKIKNLISNTKSLIFPESYRLKTPASPHYAAKLDNTTIDLNKIELPKTNNHLIIEGAGGIMVPLNQTTLIIDLIKKLNTEVILVSKNYLGSINHTLLSIEILKYHKIPIKGLVFSGEGNPSTENFILQYTDIACLGKVPFIKPLNKQNIKLAGNAIKL